jgi:hypothetical protein
MHHFITATAKLVHRIAQKPKTPQRDALMARAMNEEFHDFHAPETGSGCPKVDLVNELRKLGYHDISAAAIDGEFDDTPCEKGRCVKCEEIDKLGKEIGLW